LQRVNCVKHWLLNFAPEEVKFSLAKQLPPVTLTDQEVGFLNALSEKLAKTEWLGDNIHNSVYDCAKESGIPAKSGFQALYQIFIDKKQGPRLGYFLSTLDKAFVLQRIAEAVRSID
jgi:lysyl-tRNA synthetase class 1